jgi:hypothetical protein
MRTGSSRVRLRGHFAVGVRNPLRTVALAGIAAGVLAVATGSAGAATFTLQPTPIPAGATTSYLTDLSCSSAKDCTAVGTYASSSGTYTPYALRWDGTQWSLQSVPSPAGAQATDLDGVNCVTAKSCVASGVVTYPSTDPYSSNASTLIERWDGTSWTIEKTANPYTSGYTQELYSVSCSARIDCTAVGDYNGTTTGTIAERANGKKWSIQPTPTDQINGDQLTGVACPATSSCVAVGEGAPGVPLAEQWDGTSWTQDQIPLPGTSGGTIPSTGSPYRVSCTDASTCMAVGTWYPNGNSGQPLAESLSGTTWTAQNAAEISGSYSAGGGLGDVSCTSSDACTAVGEQTEPDGSTVQTLAERWDGAAWTIIKTPNLASHDESLDGIGCTGAAAKKCIVVGDYQDGTGHEQGMAGTTS